MSAQFFAPKEVAELLRVSLRTVERWIASGVLPIYEIGGTIRISKQDIERCRRKRTRPRGKNIAD
jgi:excisionase family DNA binding protein